MSPQFLREKSITLESLPTAAFICDNLGHIISFNEKARTLWKRTPTLDETFCGAMRYFDKYGLEIPKDQLPSSRALSEENSVHLRAYMQRFDGTLLFVEIISSALREGGETVGSLNLLYQTTENSRKKDGTTKKVEEQILVRHERSRMSEIFNLTPTFICSFKGPEHTYEIANNNYLKLVGFKNVINRPVSEIAPEFLSQNTYFIQFLNEAYFSKNPVLLSENSVFIQRKQNGILEEAYIDFVFQPVIEEDNSVSGVFVHGIDVTERVRARKRIEESQQRLSLAINAAGLATWVWDIRDDTVHVTEGYVNLIGDKQEFSEKSLNYLIKFIHKEDRSRVIEVINRSILERTTYEFECRIYASNGQLQWIESKGMCLYNEQGNPQKVLGTLSEITHKKNAGLILQISEQKFRQMAEILPQFVWTLTPKGKCTYLNKRWTTYTGQTEDQCLEYGWREVVHSGDIENLRKVLAKAAQDAMPAEHEFRIRNSEGIFRWFLARGLPIKDAHGNITQWIGSCTDIDDQKSAQEDHRFLSEAAKLFAPISDPQEVIDTLVKLSLPKLADWCCLDLVTENQKIKRSIFILEDTHKPNSVTLLPGYPIEIMQSECAWQMRQNEQNDIQLFFNEKQFSHTIDSSIEKNIKNLDLFSYLAIPLKIHNRVFGVFSFIYSTSKRRYYEKEVHLAEELVHRASLTMESSRLFKQLETAVRVRDDFLSIASHELKTPLTPLKMHLQILTRALQKGELQKIPLERLTKMVGISDKQVNNLVSLVDDLLDVSRIANGKLELRCENMDLFDVVQEVIEHYNEQIVSSLSTIEVTKRTETISGCWDRFRIQQCVANLISNSLKYGRGKPIHIFLEQNNEKAFFIIQDQGLGISEEKQLKIFDRFERAVFESGISGLGLGLYIVKEIITAHHGNISVQSKLGAGSTFIVELPVSSC